MPRPGWEYILLCLPLGGREDPHDFHLVAVPLCPGLLAAVIELRLSLRSLAFFLYEQVSGHRTFAPAGLGSVVVLFSLIPPPATTHILGPLGASSLSLGLAGSSAAGPRALKKETLFKTRRAGGEKGVVPHALTQRLS